MAMAGLRSRLFADEEAWLSRVACRAINLLAAPCVRCLKKSQPHTCIR